MTRTDRADGARGVLEVDPGAGGVALAAVTVVDVRSDGVTGSRAGRRGA